MPTIDEVKSQISLARQQANQQRAELIQRKEEASQAEAKLREQEQKLLNPSQKLLRGGLYEGLEGRKRRGVVDFAKKQIQANKAIIQDFKKQMDQYEQNEIVPFENKIAQKEAELASYEQQKSAYDLAKKAFYENKPALILNNSLAREYYNEFESGREAQIQQAITNLENQSGMSFSDQLRKDVYMQLKTTGKATLPDKNSYQPLPASIAPPRDLPRNDVKKSWNPIKNINVKSLATGTLKIILQPFFTAGSPEKFTPLLKPTPTRGYESVKASKSIIPRTIPKKPYVTLSSKLTKKDKKSFLKISNKKNKSIWGADSLISKPKKRRF